jgi:hypothetical protein
VVIPQIEKLFNSEAARLLERFDNDIELCANSLSNTALTINTELFKEFSEEILNRAKHRQSGVTNPCMGFPRQESFYVHSAPQAIPSDPEQ